ncbi:hypothetical protein O0I10_007064 [Lichtheimia ornata]|uniref:Uncharacterized protein n=1 Tax=Lichtheimia ornata TaxID=688661 RepID=A0AAD7XY42_9FUNG|nr:uncharacterized protein O0I10_007064 [Lichtheimia ornata]KAJ8657248.1 hypothetical protein O0I10_007064 [Lichtheimia ornata]
MATSTKKYFQTTLSFTPLNKGKARAKESLVEPPASKKPRIDKENQSSSTTPKKSLSLNKAKKNTGNSKPQLKTSSRPFAFTKTDPIEPPTFTRIPLQFSEEEIWARLQIREFVFRFGEHFNIDSRVITSMQNVQGNWRIKRLSINIALELLQSMEQGYIETPVSSALATQDIYFKGARTMQAIGTQVMREWMEDRGLTDHKYMTADVARITFVEELERDGLTASHWEDLGFVLLAAGFNDHLSQALKNASKLKATDHIYMIQMMCDLLLFHSQLRRQWVMADGNNKEHKTVEAALRVERRRCENSEDSKIYENRLALEKRYLELTIASHRSTKRLEPAGYDNKGNEYWIFNDLITAHGGCGADSRNSEPFWAYSVVAIGPGPAKTTTKERQWWHVSDIEDILQLRKWLEKEEAPSSQFTQQLIQRVQYLHSLRWIEAQGKSGRKAIAK